MNILASLQKRVWPRYVDVPGTGWYRRKYVFF